LKLGSKKFWRFASLVAVLSLAAQAAAGLMKSKRPNERTLAGIRPGRDQITVPQKKLGEPDREESATEELLWDDICTRRELRVELNASKTVQVVTVEGSYKPEITAKCLPLATAPSRLQLLATGHGLP